jgi:hypothetical protein
MLSTPAAGKSGPPPAAALFPQMHIQQIESRVTYRYDAPRGYSVPRVLDFLSLFWQRQEKPGFPAFRQVFSGASQLFAHVCHPQGPVDFDGGVESPMPLQSPELLSS